VKPEKIEETPKEEIKEEIKETPKEEIKEIPKEETKEEIKEAPKEGEHDQTPITPKVSRKFNTNSSNKSIRSGKSSNSMSTRKSGAKSLNDIEKDKKRIKLVLNKEIFSQVQKTITANISDTLSRLMVKQHYRQYIKDRDEKKEIIKKL